MNNRIEKIDNLIRRNRINPLKRESAYQESKRSYGLRKIEKMKDIDEFKEMSMIELSRKPNVQLRLGLDPYKEKNLIPFSNLHKKVHFKTIE